MGLLEFREMARMADLEYRGPPCFCQLHEHCRTETRLQRCINKLETGNFVTYVYALTSSSRCDGLGSEECKMND